MRYESTWYEARDLTRRGVIGIRWGEWPDSVIAPFPDEINPGDRIEGMLLGIAMGDSLGNTSESLLPAERFKRFGWIENYLPNRHKNNQTIGLPSDDTQLSYWVLERLIEDGKFIPRNIGIALSRRRIFGIGKSVREFLRAFKDGEHWSTAGSLSAGNGALMRIAPTIVPHVAKPTLELWGDVALSAHLTHRDGMSTASCLTFAVLLMEAMRKPLPPPGEWWVRRFLAILPVIEPLKSYESRQAPINFNGRLSELITDHVIRALEQDLTVADACGKWHSGAYCLETVPSVLYILARHGNDPQQAILEAVNNTKDNDTIASIVGAAVGAAYGVGAFRSEWLDGLVGRTSNDDDQQIFRLIERAGKTFNFSVSEYTKIRSKGFKEPNVPVTHPSGMVEIRSKKFWVKIIAMLQQSWASIELMTDGSYCVYFFDDHGAVFDRLPYPDEARAVNALRRNGFDLYADEQHGSFLSRPGPSFQWGNHTNGSVYSSGRFWIGD